MDIARAIASFFYIIIMSMVTSYLLTINHVTSLSVIMISTAVTTIGFFFMQVLLDKADEELKGGDE